MVKGKFIKHIIQEFRSIAESLADPIQESIIRIQTEWEKTDILNWLGGQNNSRKIYWSDRDKCCEVGGIGMAHRVSGENIDDFSNLFNRLDGFLSNGEQHLKYYGGIRFNYKVDADALWHKFHTFDFIIPEYELLRSKDKYYLAVNIHLKDSDKVEDKIAGLERKLNALSFYAHPMTINFPELDKRLDIPNRKEWSKRIDQVYSMFASGELDKIVLARKSILNFNSALNPIHVVKRLKESNPNAFHFCIQEDDGVSLIGATPERLYKRNQRQIFTEAIAGTRPRGKTAERDSQLKKELLSCEKDLREHRYVVDKIKSVIADTCTEILSDKEVNIIENAHVQHLCYKMQGKLKDNITDAYLLRNIHPTPAVGGYPSDIALNKIEKMEKFDRGWYAGPVGWVNHSAAEFAVALRSGLIYGNKLALFAGAGIVDGSKADEEWDEIENKIYNFMQILKNHKNAG